MQLQCLQENQYPSQLKCPFTLSLVRGFSRVSCCANKYLNYAHNIYQNEANNKVILYILPYCYNQNFLYGKIALQLIKFKQTIYALLGVWIFPLVLEYWHSSVIVSLLITTVALSIMKFGFPLDTQLFTSDFKLQMSHFFLCCTSHSVFWLFSFCLKLKQLPGNVNNSSHLTLHLWTQARKH